MIRKTTFLAASLVPLLTLSAIACGGGPTLPGGTGGASASGGASGVGGGVGTGGVGTGGIVGAGGVPGAGGGSSGGAGPGSGGGTGSGGGGPVTAEWGLVENPGAECSVGPMPSRDSLTANPKLPDTFKKMDGTRIADKSEWACRREEIRQQALQFIYGDKPVPAAGSVSGTVSTSSISVQVNDGGTTSFNVTVDMNGATAPAAAIITYGPTSMPIPSGVAKITFSPIEQAQVPMDSPKSGPFYTLYGSDHPAGYLLAQAWQISRIIDVLELNPGTIDPYRIGVTGCSRSGKGAFVAGVFDNRIALTMPIESGIGGIAGLRLIQSLEPGNPSSESTTSEWPYHAISYVRWMSEVALGAFTTANDNPTADETEELPIDMHDMMALIAPRGLYIVDNPNTGLPRLDPKSSNVAARVGQMAFEALGVGDHFTYEGASGGHCEWRTAYTAPLQANIQRFLLGDDTANTGTFNTVLANPPNPEDHIDWTVPTLTGEL